MNWSGLALESIRKIRWVTICL